MDLCYLAQANDFYNNIVNGNLTAFCKNCRPAIQQSIFDNAFLEGN